MQTAKQKYFDKKRSESPLVQCACGCGKELKSVDKYGRPVAYISGHNGRMFEGKEATNWARQKRYREKNPDALRDAKRNYYRARKIKAMALLGNKCKFCGIEYDGKNSPIFEFHHTDPLTKDGGVTRMLTNQAWTKTVEEIAKCVLTCANCHNKYHGGEW
jgi:hypothetical protein